MQFNFGLTALCLKTIKKIAEVLFLLFKAEGTALVLAIPRSFLGLLITNKLHQNMTEMRLKCHIKYLTDVNQITSLTQEVGNSPIDFTDRFLLN